MAVKRSMRLHSFQIVPEASALSGTRTLFAEILRLIAELRPPTDPAREGAARLSWRTSETKGEVRLGEDQIGVSGSHHASCYQFGAGARSRWGLTLTNRVPFQQSLLDESVIGWMSG
jgi:hypothetical protein